MSNGPGILNPWFVVQKLNENRHMVFFHSVDEGDPFSPIKGTALLFMSLHSASRVALAEAAEVRVLFSNDDAKEFGR